VLEQYYGELRIIFKIVISMKTCNGSGIVEGSPRFKFAMVLLLLFTPFIEVFADVNRGIALFENKNYAEARVLFTDMLRNNPDHHISLYYLGKIDFEEGDFGSAIIFLDKAVSLAPNHFKYYFWRGRTNLELLFRANLIMKAVYASRTLKDFEKAVELNPNDLYSRIYLGEYYAQAPALAGGSVAKSIAHFRAAMINHPQERYLYVGLGNQYRNLGNYDSAFWFYGKGAEIDPHYPNLQYEMGKASASSGRNLLQAERSLLDALKNGLDDTNRADAFFQLGRVREQLNKNELSRDAYRRCLEINPDMGECRRALRRLK
jgi:tetratricopeptide (TPR) repeat protein